MLYLMLAGYGCQTDTEAPPPLVLATQKSLLHQALLELGITPLDKATVKADKDKLLKKALLVYRFRYIGSPVTLAYLITLTTIVAAFLVSAIASGGEWGTLAVIFVLMLSVSTFSWRMRHLINQYFPHQLPLGPEYIIWVTSPLINWLYYNKPIPADARKKVEVVRRALPAAQFFVEWMDVDPYLVVELEGYREPIHGWK